MICDPLKTGSGESFFEIERSALAVPTVAIMQGENSEVLPMLSVAVAVMKELPPGNGGKPTLKLAVQAMLVDTLVEPMN